MQRKVILASASPRRQELLAGLGVAFTVDTENSFQETIPEDMPHPQVPVAMARGKSHGFHRPLADDEILLTADTMVLLGGLLLGKPHSREEAMDMLGRLSGATHEVITAVTARTTAIEKTVTDSTLVHFRELTQAEMEYYIDQYRPYDKAGAYGVQEWIGYVGITGIEGSFYNVMGFPVAKVYKLLEEAGYSFFSSLR